MKQQYLSVVLGLLFLFNPFLKVGAVESLFVFQESKSIPSVYPVAMPSRVSEWAISADADLIAQETLTLSVPLFFSDGKKKIFRARQSSSRDYENGNRQWVGKLFDANKTPMEFYQGSIILNVIDNQMFGVIYLGHEIFEIYSQAGVGTRLARVSFQAMEMDAIYAIDDPHSRQDHTLTKDASDYFDLPLETAGVPSVSRIDVLVLVDTELAANAGIWQQTQQRIANDKMIADAILSQSGNTGVPINLNLVATVPIDIPDALEDIYYDRNTGATPNFSELTEGGTTSLAMQSLRQQYQADIVALYVPFTPGPATPSRFEFCGQAGLPRFSFEDDYFSNSFSVMSINCTPAQLVFLHEIMHNFGSGHTYGSNASFQSYANGIGNTANAIATLMACEGTFSDPSTTSCGRIMRLSDPDDTWNGVQIGHQNFADNVRFLSECTSAACRRDQLENRVDGPPNNIPPSVAITAPSDNAQLGRSPSYVLRANASDDSGIAQFRWQIRTANSNLLVDQVVAPPYNLSTNVFANIGTYFVSARVTDDQNESATDTHRVDVINVAPSVNILSPLDGLKTPRTDSFQLRASISDDSEITQVRWQIFTSNNTLLLDQLVSAPFDLNVSTFSQLGTYRVVLTALDDDQASASDAHTVEVIDLPPHLEIVQPAQDSRFLQTQSFSLTANASDDESIERVTWRIFNGSTLIFSAHGQGLSYEAITDAFLNVGAYLVEAEALDNSGQSFRVQHEVKVLERVTDIESTFAYSKNLPFPVVVTGIRNLGPVHAENVVFSAEVRSLRGSASVSSIPKYCDLDYHQTEGNSGEFTLRYRCNIPYLKPGTSFQLTWDDLCPGRLSHDGSSYLNFSVALIDMLGSDSDPVNNSTSGSYFHPNCTAPQ